MHKIHFYRNKNGIAPVYEYLKELNSRTDKNSRIKAGKVNDYITRLSEEGTFAGLPYVKHIEGDIWELRPLRDRIFFVACTTEAMYCYTNSRKKLKKLQHAKSKKLVVNMKI